MVDGRYSKLDYVNTGGFYGQKQRRRKPQDRRFFIGRPLLGRGTYQRREIQPAHFRPPLFRPFRQILFRRQQGIFRQRRPEFLRFFFGEYVRRTGTPWLDASSSGAFPFFRAAPVSPLE